LCVLILAMDTCDARGSVALVEFAAAKLPEQTVALPDASVLALEAHLTGEDYSTWLLPAVELVLQVTGKRLDEVNVVAAAAGPGSFTGIRIALTTAKAWNEVLGVPIAAVSRLQALARQARFAKIGAAGEKGASGPQFVVASCDAQRGHLYGAVYRCGSDSSLGRVASWERLGDERVVSPGELIGWGGEEAGDAPIAWVSLDPGSLTSDPAWQARARLGEMVEQAPGALAPAIAHVAVEMATGKRLTDALALDANYIRRPDAEVKWKGYAKPLATRPPAAQAALSCDIRPFAAADAAFVARIAASSPEAAHWPESSYAEMLGRGYAGWVAVARGAGGIIGFAITRSVSPDAELLNLAVLPAERRRGVAAALLRAATEALRRQGIQRLWLEVRSSNAAAISFYKKHLFRVTGSRPRYYRNPEDDALLMERNIHSP
jgi:tRNA threonylcarbamoyladenosine biosynthesis protein TsaB